MSAATRQFRWLHVLPCGSEAIDSLGCNAGDNLPPWWNVRRNRLQWLNELITTVDIDVSEIRTVRQYKWHTAKLSKYTKLHDGNLETYTNLTMCVCWPPDGFMNMNATGQEYTFRSGAMMLTCTVSRQPKKLRSRFDWNTKYLHKHIKRIFSGGNRC